MFFGLLLAIVILFKPQKYLGKLSSVKKLFKSGIPDENIPNKNLLDEKFNFKITRQL